MYLGGWVSAAFFLVGAPAALLVGYISDRVNRKHLLLWVVLLGEWQLCHGHCMCGGGDAALMQFSAAPCSFPCAHAAPIGAAIIHCPRSLPIFAAGEGPCLLTFFVSRYWQLLVLRLLTGISVGGCFPLLFSLLGDLFGASERVLCATGVQIATGLGTAAGQSVSGFLGEQLCVHSMFGLEAAVRWMLWLSWTRKWLCVLRLVYQPLAIAFPLPDLWVLCGPCCQQRGEKRSSPSHQASKTSIVQHPLLQAACCQLDVGPGWLGRLP